MTTIQVPEIHSLNEVHHTRIQDGQHSIYLYQRTINCYESRSRKVVHIELLYSSLLQMLGIDHLEIYSNETYHT